MARRFKTTATGKPPVLRPLRKAKRGGSLLPPLDPRFCRRIRSWMSLRALDGEKLLSPTRSLGQDVGRSSLFGA
jgi:hypothetical protein